MRWDMPHAVDLVVRAVGDCALKHIMKRRERKALGCKEKKQNMPPDGGR